MVSKILTVHKNNNANNNANKRQYTPVHYKNGRAFIGTSLFGYIQIVLCNVVCATPNLYCDAPEAWQFGFQDAATPMMQGIIDLHHDIVFFLVVIILFVSWMLVRTLWHFNATSNPIPARIVHGTTIEIIWTIFPSIILMFIAIPSFALLYSMDEVVDPAVTIKAIGHQWYWSYEGRPVCKHTTHKLVSLIDMW